MTISEIDWAHLGQIWTQVLQFTREQGGLLALIAGLIAYAAGRRQAKGTLRASRDQVVMMARQLNQAKIDASERDNRQVRALLHALSIEAARIKCLAQERHHMADLQFDRPGQTGDVTGDYKPFMIDTACSFLRGQNVASVILEKNVLGCAINVVARVDQLNSMLEARVPFGRLSGRELKGALLLVIEAGAELQQAIEWTATGK